MHANKLKSHKNMQKFPMLLFQHKNRILIYAKYNRTVWKKNRQVVENLPVLLPPSGLLSFVFSFFCQPLSPFLQLPKSRLPYLFSRSLSYPLVFSTAPYLFSVFLILQASTCSLLPPSQVTSLPHVHATLPLKKLTPRSWKWNAQLTSSVRKKNSGPRVYKNTFTFNVVKRRIFISLIFFK